MGNLIQNGDFEQGALYWSIPSESWMTNDAFSGSQAVTIPANSTMVQVIETNKFVPFTDHFVSFRYKPSNCTFGMAPIQTDMYYLNFLKRSSAEPWTAGIGQYREEVVYERDAGREWAEVLFKFRCPAIQASQYSYFVVWNFADAIPVTVDDFYLGDSIPNGGGNLVPLLIIGGLGVAGAVAYYLWKRK